MYNPILQKGICMINLLNVINSSSILGFWSELGDELLNAITRPIGALLWGLCDIFFVILDLFETIFKAFAGTLEGGVKVQGEQVEGDIVLYLMNSKLVQQIFMSIFILSLFLLIVFTIFAIVKNQYSDKQEPVSKIVNASFKALFMYLLVPVATVVCLMVANVVLQAVDEATSTQTSGGASDMLFVAAAYNANKLRDTSHEDNVARLKLWYDTAAITGIERDIKEATGITSSTVDSTTPEQMEVIASLVDDAFSTNTLNAVGGFSGQWNFSAVTIYYDSFRMSYITVWIGGAFLIGAIGKIAWGLVGRIFKMTIYFAISPAVMATFPLDNGKALGTWRGEMVKQGSMSICAVGVLNVLYSILPLFKGINIGAGIGGSLIKLFVTIVAFSSAKDLISAISGWFGTGDAYAEGVKTKGQVTKPLKTAAMKGIGMFGGIKGGLDAAKKQGKTGFWNTIGSAATGAAGGLGFKNPYSDAYQKAIEGGKGATKEFYTKDFAGNRRDKAADIWEANEAIAKENKAIEAKIAQMEAVRDRQLQELRNKGIGPSDKQYQEVEKSWQKAMDKLKASASYLDTLFETTKMDLEERQKKQEKRQSNFASFDSLERAFEQEKALMDRIISSTGATGQAADDLKKQWDRIKVGDFSGISNKGHKQALKESYGLYASDIASNDQDIQRAKQAISNLANSGDSGLSYVRDTLGDQFDKMFKETRDATGKLVYELESSVSSEDISAKIRAEQKSINDALDALEKENLQMFQDRLSKFGNVTLEEKEKIGRNKK